MLGYKVGYSLKKKNPLEGGGSHLICIYVLVPYKVLYNMGSSLSYFV